MMGKNTGCLKFLKDDNQSLLIVHCVIHRENLVAKNVALNCMKYYILRSNISILSREIPKQNVCSRSFVRLIIQIM